MRMKLVFFVFVGSFLGAAGVSWAVNSCTITSPTTGETTQCHEDTTDPGKWKCDAADATACRTIGGKWENSNCNFNGKPSLCPA